MELQGVVVQGAGKGKQRGFPTANIILNKSYPFLREGVYAAFITLQDTIYPSALAAQIEKKKVQAHLIDYSGENFYGQPIVIQLVEQISQMEHFDSEQELIQKIQRDIEVAKKILEK